jgi:hypothetical protein
VYCEEFVVLSVVTSAVFFARLASRAEHQMSSYIFRLAVLSRVSRVCNMITLHASVAADHGKALTPMQLSIALIKIVAKSCHWLRGCCYTHQSYAKHHMTNKQSSDNALLLELSALFAGPRSSRSGRGWSS